MVVVGMEVEVIVSSSYYIVSISSLVSNRDFVISRIIISNRCRVLCRYFIFYSNSSMVLVLFIISIIIIIKDIRWLQVINKLVIYNNSRVMDRQFNSWYIRIIRIIMWVINSNNSSNNMVVMVLVVGIKFCDRYFLEES